MKNTKKILNIIVSIITGFLLILTLSILIIGIKANKENKIPQIFGYTYSTVSTPSMVPVIEVGDIIITKDYDFEDVVVEDIIVFYSPKEDKHIVHRVVEINEDGSLITKGDANNSRDSEPVLEEHYIGKVIKIVPGLGKVVLESRNILFLIIVTIFITIIIIEIINIVKNINQDRREKLEKELKEKYNLDNNKQED